MSGLRQGGSTMSALPRPAGRMPTANKGGFPQDLPSKPGTPEKHIPGRMLNLMFDPRVIRGSTQVRRKVDLSDQSCHDAVPVKKIHKEKTRHIENKGMVLSEPSTTRKHLDIQTDAYLEELVENVSQFDIDTQTDAFLDRPPTPLFIPQKSGPDVGTQIEEGDLFNFDEEVEPMLEVLVGRTLEQAIMEVMEEKQLASLHAYQEHFEQIRAAELVATQRMEAAERRIMEEKRKRIQQEKKRIEEEQKIKEKSEAQMYAKNYLKNLMDSIFITLQKLDYFYDPVEREVEEMYLPFLMNEMNKEIEKISLSWSTLNCMVERTIISSEERARASVRKVIENIVSQVESNDTKEVETIITPLNQIDHTKEVLDDIISQME